MNDIIMQNHHQHQASKEFGDSCKSLERWLCFLTGFRNRYSGNSRLFETESLSVVP